MLSRRSALLATPALLLASRVMAQSGIFNDRIVFGQAAPLDGPAAALGTGMRDGILAAFAEANKAGGVHGRKLELIARDDGYEPTRSANVTRQLISEDNVFALIGPVGTPTSQAAQPIAAEAGVPFIGPFTGAEFLRDAKLANVINLRASYFQETEEMVERLTRDLGASRIAILFQDDAFGRAGLAGVQRALTKRNMALVAEGTYERNTVAVRGAALAIQRGRPDAVIMVGAYKPCAEFIKTARQLRLNATFVNISFVGSDALAQELGAAGVGVVVTQVVPFPGDESLAMVKRYRTALAAAIPNSTPGFVSLEGYAVGRLAIAALAKAANPPTRDSLLNTIRTNSFDIDGMPLSFSAEKNQGSDKVWLTVIQADGSFRAVERFSGTQG
ncbi:MAG: ABC transporter substrate-binding protein [Roseomonas sp.]|nr:ABC transporter substrate-binding protein [Roseomonas sp.]